MKQCNTCKKTKPYFDFYYKAKSKQLRSSLCKSCQAQARKRSYNKNRASYIKASAEGRTKSRRRNRQFVFDYLALHPCVDCGESDPVVLDFDHRDRDTKILQVSSLSAHSIKRLSEEIAKCDIRCSNCHRRRTAKQFNWYSYM